MSDTLIEKLAKFSAETTYESLPEEVIVESKRVLVDSIGCALGGVHGQKGKVGIELGRITGGSSGDATIIGTPYKSSVIGAAFANGELINDLDFDSVLPPGHVSPYVLPGIFSIGEQLRVSGKELLRATAVSHEISYRFGKSMDYTRDTKSGGMSTASVIGYSSTVFGAAVGASMMLGAGQEELAHSLAIAAATSPVNSHRAWMTQVPAATIKYLVAGTLSQAALDAAYFAKLGHKGAMTILDDAEFGYRTFIGTQRWEPANIENELGTAWGWPIESSIKPYPHCRILHAPLDALTELVSENDLHPDEIDAIRVWGEAWVLQGVWLNREITSVTDAQMSIANGIAVGAHRIQPGPKWHDPAVFQGESVLALMDKVTYAAHPKYVEELQKNPSARASRVEIDARGTTFSADRLFPPGVVSPDPKTYMTDDDLIAKFHVNAEGVIPRDAADALVQAVYNLDQEADFSRVMRLLAAADA